MSKLDEAIKTYKLDTEIKKRIPIHVSVSCKHCIFYKKRATYLKPCSELGVDDQDDPCIRFTPNLASTRDEMMDAVAALKAIGGMADLNISMILALILSAKRAKATGFKLGEPVKVTVGKATVSGVAAGGWRGMVTVISDTGTVMSVPAKNVRKV